MRLNRLVIIGNGFDLAHNLPTSYRDFIKYYISHCFNKAAKDQSYNDTLLSIKKLFDPNYRHKQFIENYFQPSHNDPLIPEANYLFETKINSGFFQNIIKGYNNKEWVDIEQMYYDNLLTFTNVNINRKHTKVVELNNQLKDIIYNLNQYLSTIKQSEINEKINFLIYNKGGLLSAQKVSEICLLNFNHTKTADQYLHSIPKICPFKKPSILNIHGQINDEINPIIFGFGDDLDLNYKTLELFNDNEYLRFIKTFQYLETDNLKQLNNFINQDNFEVFIMGHSCGLTDRTLLQRIFQHQLCQQIKIYYHARNDGTDNYQDIAKNMSRHFNDKNEFRNKLMNRLDSEPLPQN